MKDYSDWKINLDFENESSYVNPNRPQLKFRAPDVPKSIKFDPIPIHEFIKLIARKFSNIGLGLTLVNKIIENLNGKIKVEDKIEGDYSQGSVFTILIPTID